MPQIRLALTGHAKLATSVCGSGTECPVPPLRAARKQRDMILKAKLAPALLEIPAAFIANRKIAARAAKGERLRAETAPAESTAPAREQIYGHEKKAAECGHGDRDPHDRVDVQDDEGDANTHGRAASDQCRYLPDATERKLQKLRCPGPAESEYAGDSQRYGQTEQRREELRREADARQSEDQSDEWKTVPHVFRSLCAAKRITMVGWETQFSGSVPGPFIFCPHACDDFHRQRVGLPALRAVSIPPDAGDPLHRLPFMPAAKTTRTEANGPIGENLIVCPVFVQMQRGM